MDKLSYQLYSSRENPPLDKTLAMLAEAGYREVEGFGGVFQDPAATAAALKGAGLEMPSGHFQIEALEGELQSCLDTAGTLGMKTVYSPYLAPEDRPVDAAGWSELGRRLSSLRESVVGAGFAFGWHNHDFEMRPLDDGTVPLDLVLGADEGLEWEADLAWVVKGDADPLEWIEKYRDRITAVHVKDIAPAGECADEDGWADVGKGTMDWPGLLKALEGSPVRHFVVEHDKPSDDARFAKASAEFLLAL